MPVTGRRSFLWGLGGASALAMLGTGWSAHATQGQSWPARPIRLVVTFPPGGSSDIVARILAPLLAEKIYFPIQDGIPVMLPEAAQPLTDAERT